MQRIVGFLGLVMQGILGFLEMDTQGIPEFFGLVTRIFWGKLRDFLG